MTHKQIKNLLLVCPPTRNDCGDSRLRKALKTVEKDPDLLASLKAQIQFDGRIASELRAVSPPPSLVASAANVESILSHQIAPAMSPRDPAILSVAIAFILLLGLLGWLAVGKISSFPGSAEAWQMVLEGNKVRMNQLDPITLKMDAMGDWFAMKGMDQFWAPASVKNWDVINARVFTSSDVPVAMGIVEQPRVFFYAFNGNRLGIAPTKEGVWKILTRDGKTIGVTRQGESIFIIELRGNPTNLRRILAEIGSTSR